MERIISFSLIAAKQFPSGTANLYIITCECMHVHKTAPVYAVMYYVAHV